MLRKGSLFKKLTAAALLSAVGCASPMTRTASKPAGQSGLLAFMFTGDKKPKKKAPAAAVVQASHTEGPELDLPPVTATALEEVASGKMPGLEKVPESPTVSTSEEESKESPEVVKASFVEQPPMHTKVKKPAAGAVAAPTKEEVSASADEAAEEEAGPPPPLSLDEAIQLTLGANPDLQSAAERTNYADEVLARARADFFPVLAFNQNYAVSDNPLNKFSYLLSQGIGNPVTLFTPADVVDNFRTQLRLQHEIYSGGARVARSRSAQADRDAAHFSLTALQNKIVFQVAEAYYRLFQARELVKVRAESVKQVEAQLKAVKSRFNAMTAVRSDVLRVEVRLASVKESFITAKNSHELAWAVLENVAGVPLAGREVPETLPPAPWSGKLEALLNSAENGKADPSSLADAVAEAISRRPEVNEVSSRRESAEQRVHAAEAGKKPTLGLTTDYEIYSGDFRSKQTDSSVTVGVALSVNLFDAGRTKSMVRQAEAAVRELDAAQRRVHLDITLDVRKAYLQLKDASERLKVAEASVTNAEEALKQIQSRFENKTATATELLDAEVDLTDARVRTTNAGAEVEVARASLERAIGRLSELLTPTAESAGKPLPLPAPTPENAPKAERLK